MRNSPFEVFRRNQKLLMVLLTGLSMFAFLFLDSATMSSGRTPPSLTVALVALICGGGLWLVGAPRGKGSEYGLWGALLGAVVGFIAVRNSTAGEVVQTAVGSYSRMDLQHMAQRRSSANRFVSMAAQGRAPLFGGTDDRSMVIRAILLKEAQKNGIRVSDDGVDDFIKRTTENRLTVPEFRKILRDLSLPEAELFNILREELEVRLAAEMDLPSAPTVQTPLAYWKTFSKLQVKESLDVVEIPVAAFVPKVPEPKDDELAIFFENYKNRLPGADGTPGFLKNRQVQLAYLAADFETFEKLVPEPTDTEVDEYYVANKERYRIRETPQFPGRDETMPVDERTPASAVEPANRPAESAPQPPEPNLPEPGGCGGDEAQPANEAEPKQPAAEKSETAAETPKSDTGPKIPLTPSKGVTLPAEGDLQLPPSPGTTASPAAAETEPEPRYRELNDELRLEIRETILRERAFAKMAEAADRGLQEMTKLADEYLAAIEEAQRKTVVAGFSKRLQNFAELNHLTYKELQPMTQQELLSSVDEPIGQAIEPSSDQFMRGDNVAREAFSNDSVFYPRRANSIFGDKTYTYWKTADIAPRVPTLAEVKTDVIEAVKFHAARNLAQKRAEELAELARKSDKPLAEALSGQTVTGEPEAAAVVVKETPRFSWLTMPRHVPFQFNQPPPMPQVSLVEGVRLAGEEFMRIVFEQLKPGEIGVAPNHPRSDFYVVQVKQRDGVAAEADDLALRALQQQYLQEGKTKSFDPQLGMFMKPEYHMETRMSQEELFSRWRETFEKRYKIVWNEAEADMQPRGEL